VPFHFPRARRSLAGAPGGVTGLADAHKIPLTAQLSIFNFAYPIAICPLPPHPPLCGDLFP
jgi:hypothetical protein